VISFCQKSELLSKIGIFVKNEICLRKNLNFVKNFNFLEILKFLGDDLNLVNNRSFRQQFRFSDFRQKVKLSPKIETFIKHRIFRKNQGQKSRLIRGLNSG